MTDITVEWRKSAIVSNASANGGRMGTATVTSGLRHGLFPIVTASERAAGVTRYRKEYLKIATPVDAVAQFVYIALPFPSTAGDRFYFGNGSQTDTQSSLTAYYPAWMGAGQLNTALTAGVSTQIKLDMENDDFVFEPGGYIHLSSKFLASQTIASGVVIGNRVELSGGTWILATASDDITYPYGLYVGSNVVMTAHATGYEEWLEIDDPVYTDEDIGDGNGSDTAPALTTLANATNGTCTQTGYLPVVTATCGSVTRTVNVAADGTCSGYCSAGELNMSDGSWTTDITWTTAPDNATDITVTYRENPFAYSGNTVTVDLASGVTPANSYLTTNTYGGGCIFLAELAPDILSWVETSAAGTYDEVGYEPTLTNYMPYDQWTIQFTGTGVYKVTGAYSGNVLSGQSVASDGTVQVSGNTVMTILSSGWGGTWVSGDTITFTTTPCAVPIWVKQVVPVACAAAANNFITMGWQLSQ